MLASEIRDFEECTRLDVNQAAKMAREATMYIGDGWLAHHVAYSLKVDGI